MKKLFIWGLIVYGLQFITACSDMNDLHDIYLQDGEIIYIGRVDSARILAGDERFVLRYWVSDVRAKELKIYWMQKQDSVIMPIPDHQINDSIDVLIDVIPEGNHSFQLYTTDGGQLRSVVFEKIGNVYGPSYISTLPDRLVKEIAYKSTDNELTIFWSEITSSKEVGIELTYYLLDGEGSKVVSKLSQEEIGSQTVLTNIDVSKGVYYRTMFLPEPMAIDTFYTDQKRVSIEQVENVALFKNVKVSGTYNDSYIGPNAVDGVITNASRWLSTSTGEHWIEIDLGQEFAIHSFKTWNGSAGNFVNPVLKFMFQVEINGQWETIVSETNNTNPKYYAKFPEVTTSKVRYFVPEFENNLTRLYEIEVYSTISY